MRPRSAIAVFAAGLIVLVAGWFFGPHSAALTRGIVAPGTLMFPDLAQHLADAQKIEITGRGHTVELDRDGEAWGVAQRDGYPAQPQKVRALLAGLTELRLIEPRTADPALYARLGLDDPAKPVGGADLVRVLAKDGKPIAAALVGHTRARARGAVSGDAPDDVYVRAPDQDQTWLAAGRIDADTDPELWLQRDIMSFPAARIAHVTVTPAAPPGGAAPALVFATQDGKLTLTEPADHPPLDPEKVASIGLALVSVTFADVRRAGSGADGEPQAVTTIDLTDGPTITATVDKSGADYWVRFAATGKDAEALQKRVHGWDYKLPPYQAERLAPTIDRLTVPAVAPGPQGPTDPPPPAAR